MNKEVSEKLKEYNESKKCNCEYCKASRKIEALVKKYKLTLEEENFLIGLNFENIELASENLIQKENYIKKIEFLMKIAKMTPTRL